MYLNPSPIKFQINLDSPHHKKKEKREREKKKETSAPVCRRPRTPPRKFLSFTDLAGASKNRRGDPHQRLHCILPADDSRGERQLTGNIMLSAKDHRQFGRCVLHPRQHQSSRLVLSRLVVWKPQTRLKAGSSRALERRRALRGPRAG